MSNDVVLKPIGYVRSTRTEPTDNGWDKIPCRVELELPPEAVAGLEEFSHIEVIFRFHLVREEEVSLSRHPRGRTDFPLLGILAQRARRRPNRIGLTRCRVVSIHGSTIEVEGLDAIDGTPVLDIKPYVREFGPRGEVRQPPWATELFAGYWD